MEQKNRHKAASAALLILCVCAAAGCAANPKALQTNVHTADIKDVRAEGAAPEVKEFEAASETTANRADRIAQSVAKISGIGQASVVISGNTAIVGIEVSGILDDAKLIKLKGEAEKEVKRTDPSIEHVAVTAAAELVRRVTNMADSVAGGQTPANERMGDVIRQLTPPI